MDRRSALWFSLEHLNTPNIFATRREDSTHPRTPARLLGNLSRRAASCPWLEGEINAYA
jgi:hypothetical protein